MQGAIQVFCSTLLYFYLYYYYHYYYYYYCCCCCCYNYNCYYYYRYAIGSITVSLLLRDILDLRLVLFGDLSWPHQSGMYGIYFLQTLTIVKAGGPLGLSIVGGQGHTSHPFGVDSPGVFISKVLRLSY